MTIKEALKLLNDPLRPAEHPADRLQYVIDKYEESNNNKFNQSDLKELFAKDDKVNVGDWPAYLRGAVAQYKLIYNQEPK